MKRAKNPFFKTTTYKQALRMGPRRFVKEFLFPAMRREHGNGFGMATWHRDTSIVSPNGLDGIYDRPAPRCNSVMCIGGTMQAVVRMHSRSEFRLARILGLEGAYDPAALFYDWMDGLGPWNGLSKQFRAAKTPREKERIAEKAVLAAIKIGEKARR